MPSTVFTDGVTLTASSWFQAVDNVAYQYLSGVSGTNTITATGPSGLGAYAAGLKFRFIPAVTNTGATTINITGTAALGARNIFFNGLALIGGELVAGIPIEIIDDGTRFQITGGTPPNRFLTIRKTADQSITSSTTLTDDTHLKFAIAANEEWWADIYLDAGASLNTTGIRLAVTTPAGATLNVWSELAASTTDQRTSTSGGSKIGRASCRARVEQ